MSHECCYEDCEVYLWSTEEVLQWMDAVGLEDFKESIESNKIDGDLLLLHPELHWGIMAEADYETFMQCRRFSRELSRLKVAASYKNIDPTGVDEFLRGIDNDYAVYTYQMLVGGFTMNKIKHAVDEELSTEGGVVNAVHRSAILRHIRLIGLLPSPGVNVQRVTRSSTRNRFKVSESGEDMVPDIMVSASASNPSEMLNRVVSLMKTQRANVTQENGPLSWSFGS